MRVILFGATGMVGAAALIECFEDPRVTSVVAVVRRPIGKTHPKLREVLHQDFYDYSAIKKVFVNADACFFCLGVSAVGKSEEEYTHLTYDLTLAAAKAMVSVNPQMTFVYITGQGTDSTERGSAMWARVKGKTENAILALPFRAAYMLRPGYIQPMKGVRSGTRLYQWIYNVVTPLYPLFEKVAPNRMTTSERVGRAFVEVAANGYPKKILEVPDINAIGDRRAATKN